MTEVCLLVILALDSHIGTRALARVPQARVPMWLPSANIAKRHTSDILLPFYYILNNSNYDHFLHSDCLRGNLYLSINYTRKNF